MLYELEIEDGKEKPVINFLKQLDFITVRSVKKPRSKKVDKKSTETGDLPYFGACPDWEMDVKEMRKKDTARRLEGWL
jgi:hypothetical protein